jgi:SAM-dependent methyltransferase
MLRYAAATAALRVLAATPAGRRAYRLLSQTVGARRRERRGLHVMYVERARDFLGLVREFELIHDGDRLLELGTGWMHWEATVLRLFYDVSVTLFDVVDNRQLGAYRRCFEQLAPLLDGFDADPTAVRRARARIEQISRASSFDELYAAFGFRYVVEPSGSLQGFEGASFSSVYSVNTLEHVQRDILPEFVRDLFRICAPGGSCVQRIDLGDHVSYYDQSVSRKHYLHYSDRTWALLFQNQLQYINRVQRPEWLALFREAGFELLAERRESISIDARRVARQYRPLTTQDLECKGLTGVWIKRAREAQDQRSIS